MKAQRSTETLIRNPERSDGWPPLNLAGEDLSCSLLQAGCATERHNLEGRPPVATRSGFCTLSGYQSPRFGFGGWVVSIWTKTRALHIAQQAHS